MLLCKIYPSVVLNTEKHALLTVAENPLVSSDDAQDLVYKDDEHYSIEEGDHPVAIIGSRAQCWRDSIVKYGKIVNMLLDPSKTQYLCTIK